MLLNSSLLMSFTYFLTSCSFLSISSYLRLYCYSPTLAWISALTNGGGLKVEDLGREVIIFTEVRADTFKELVSALIMILDYEL